VKGARAIRIPAAQKSKSLGEAINGESINGESINGEAINKDREEGGNE
jgi:hypothetical protein